VPCDDAKADGDEGHERDADGGQRAPQDGPEGDDERGGEEHIRERDDAFEIEAVGVHASVEVIERAAPPGEQQRDRERRAKRREGDEPELGRRPAAPRDALCPGQAERSLLELEHERRGEQDRDQAGDELEPAHEAGERVGADTPARWRFAG
jgi:hypothetical protein